MELNATEKKISCKVRTLILLTDCASYADGKSYCHRMSEKDRLINWYSHTERKSYVLAYRQYRRIGSVIRQKGRAVTVCLSPAEYSAVMAGRMESLIDGSGITAQVSMDDRAYVITYNEAFGDSVRSIEINPWQCAVLVKDFRTKRIDAHVFDTLRQSEKYTGLR